MSGGQIENLWSSVVDAPTRARSNLVVEADSTVTGLLLSGARACGVTSKSPREMSISSSKVSVTASPVMARGSVPSKVTMSLTRVWRPEPMTTTGSPDAIEPAATVPEKRIRPPSSTNTLVATSRKPIFCSAIKSASPRP